jgi:hypothetical protein
MKGKINYIDGKWIVDYIHYEFPPIEYNEILLTLPLHPDDIKQIEEDSKIFDNIVSRILCYPEVEFNILEECPHYNGSHYKRDCSCKTGFIQYAKLKTKKQ